MVFVVLFFQKENRFIAGASNSSNESMRKRNFIKTDRSARVRTRNKLLVAAGVVLALYFLSSFVLGEMGLVKYYRMKSQYNALAMEIAKLKLDNVRLRKTVSSLKSDPAYLERIARDKLGLARPGEIVYYYGEPER